MTVRKSTHVQKITLKWCLNLFVTSRITEAGKTHWAFSYSITSKLIINFGFYIQTGVRLNLFISYFIMVSLHGKVIVTIASQMFLLLLQLTFITKFHLTLCFKNFLPSSSIPFPISEALLKEVGY